MTERSRESELTGGYALMDQQDAPPLAKNNFFFPSALIVSLQVCASNLAFQPMTRFRRQQPGVSLAAVALMWVIPTFWELAQPLGPGFGILIYFRT